MSWLRSIRSAPDARVLCISNRLIDPVVSRCLRFEFEDSAAALDRIDLVAPLAPRVRSRGLRGLVQRLDFGGASARLLASDRPNRRYQMLFFALQTLADLYALVPWGAWHSAADVSACYIDELYASRIRENSGAIELLRRFDVLFVTSQGTVDALAKATGRPVHFLPPSVDAISFCPYPDPPARVIDFYAMGRRPPATHASLLALAQDNHWFYHFDTVENARFTTHTEHRRRLADLIKRTRYFLVNPSMCDHPDWTSGQSELGYRFFEGAAGGTIMVGQAPHNEAAKSLFGWNDAIVPLAFDSTNISEVIRELDADRARTDRVRALNVVHSLRRHDHVYRWMEILKAVKLQPTPEIETRCAALERLAATIEATRPSEEQPRLRLSIPGPDLSGRNGSHIPAAAVMNERLPDSGGAAG